MQPIRFQILRPVERHVLFLLSVLSGSHAPIYFSTLSKGRKIAGSEPLYKTVLNGLVSYGFLSKPKNTSPFYSLATKFTFDQLQELFLAAHEGCWWPTDGELDDASFTENKKHYSYYGFRSRGDSDLEFSRMEMIRAFVTGWNGKAGEILFRTLNGKLRDDLMTGTAYHVGALIEDRLDPAFLKPTDFTFAVMPAWLTLGFLRGENRIRELEMIADHLFNCLRPHDDLSRTFGAMAFWCGREDLLSKVLSNGRRNGILETVALAFNRDFASADKEFQKNAIGVSSKCRFSSAVWTFLEAFVSGVANSAKLAKTRPVRVFKSIYDAGDIYGGAPHDNYLKELLGDAHSGAYAWKDSVAGKSPFTSVYRNMTRPLTPVECLINALNYRCMPTGRAEFADFVRTLAGRAQELAQNGYLGVAASVFALLKGGYDENRYAPLIATLRSGAVSLFEAVEPDPEWKSVLNLIEQALPKESKSKNPDKGEDRFFWLLSMREDRGDGLEVSEIHPVVRKAGSPDDGSKDGVFPWYDFKVVKHRSKMSDRDYSLYSALEPSGGEADCEMYPLLCGMPNLLRCDGYDPYYENGRYRPSPLKLTRGKGAFEVVTKEDGGVSLKIPKYLAETEQPYVLREKSKDELELVEITPEQKKLIEVFKRFGSGREVTFPHEALKIAEKTLERVSAVMPFEEAAAADASQLRRVKADARIVIRLSFDGETLDVRAVVKPQPENAAMVLEPGVGAVEKLVVGAVSSYLLVRDLAAESAALAFIVDRLGDFSSWSVSPSRWSVGELAASLEMLAALKSINPPVEIEWLEERRLKVTSVPKSSVALTSSRTAEDWFSVKGEFKLDDGRVVGLMELIQAFADREGNFVRLSDGDYLALTEAMARRLAALKAAGRRKGEALEIMPAALPMLDNVFSKGTDDAPPLPDAMAVTAEEIRKAFAKKPQVPSTLNAELRPYQEDGYRWLSRLASCGFGSCLADDMGLGKTVQTIALLLERMKDGPSLVIAPSSVCGNWRRELTRFAPSLNPVMAFESLAEIGGCRPGDVVIASYGFLLFHEDEIGAVEWNGVVLDEAQAIKNDASKRAHAVKKLKAKFRLACTGTPVENRLGELWSLFDFLNPGLLGPATSFAQRFTENGMASADLKRMVKPLILRRLKGDVLEDLPAKTEITLPIELGTAERTAYEACRRHALASLEAAQEGGGEMNRMSILAELTRLRRFCCHPSLVMGESGVPSAKLEALTGLLEELRLGGHRALVFSQFTDYLAIVRKAIEVRGWSHLYLDGSTPTPEREKLVNRFQGGEGDFFLISLKAGGTGLNLTAADYVILLDPWWNPAVENQAADRAHRIGQERPVTVYRLIASDTVEERVLELHHEKQAVAEDVLSGTGSSSLSPAQLMKLFG